MTCDLAIRKLVELARQDMTPDATTARHLTECVTCREHWDRERDLTRRMSVIRAAVPPSATRDARLRLLLASMEPAKPLGWFGRIWSEKSWFGKGWFAEWRFAWAFAAVAAVLLLSVITVKQLTHESPRLETEIASVSDTDAIQEAGFILVPYSIPLAAGETVRIVQTQLQPDALLNLGIDVDPSWNGELPAELLVGEDGVPRAVRISEETTSELN